MSNQIILWHCNVQHLDGVRCPKLKSHPFKESLPLSLICASATVVIFLHPYTQPTVTTPLFPSLFISFYLYFFSSLFLSISVSFPFCFLLSLLPSFCFFLCMFLPSLLHCLSVLFIPHLRSEKVKPKLLRTNETGQGIPPLRTNHRERLKTQPHVGRSNSRWWGHSLIECRICFHEL